jgi:hypothetical protein
MISVISGPLLSCMKAPELYCIDSQHPPGHTITPAMLGDMIKGTPARRNLAYILTVDLAFGCTKRKTKSGQ